MSGVNQIHYFKNRAVAEAWISGVRHVNDTAVEVVTPSPRIVYKNSCKLWAVDVYDDAQNNEYDSPEMVEIYWKIEFEGNNKNRVLRPSADTPKTEK